MNHPGVAAASFSVSPKGLFRPEKGRERERERIAKYPSFVADKSIAIWLSLEFRYVYCFISKGCVDCFTAFASVRLSSDYGDDFVTMRGMNITPSRLRVRLSIEVSRVICASKRAKKSNFQF